MIDYTFLLLGISYMFFTPGFVFTELFFSKLHFLKKVLLYFVLSVVVSTYLSFAIGYIWEFSRLSLSILSLFFIFISLFLFYKRRRKISFKNFFFSKDRFAYITFFLIFALFFIVLWQGIFRLQGDSIIMSGPNWQDTAMHFSIIESISQGNFPPQAPYFSGHKLSYYYFSDLHSAIASAMYDSFLPQIIVFANSFFAALFFLSVYLFSHSVTKNRNTSIFAGILSLFFGNLGFIDFIKELIVTNRGYIEVVTNNPFHLNFDSYFLMAPMVDYFLQNRPMMTGLVIFLTSAYLLNICMSERKTNLRIFIFSVLLIASLVKFQMFGFVIATAYLYLFVLVNFIWGKIDFKNAFIKIMFCSIIYIPVFWIEMTGNIEGRSLLQVVGESFKAGIIFDKGFIWAFNFVLSNFNVYFLIFIIAGFYLKITRPKDKYNFIFIFSLVLFLIPFLITFTIYKYDMFKFFYYFIPLSAVVVFGYLKHNPSKKILSVILITLLLILSVPTSINLLAHAYLNKSVAYSVNDLHIGNWIRNNTPPKSVFITYPSVHSPVSDIGGRLRVLSYINWPHSHGFDKGKDNVFTRLNDINTLYNNASDSGIVTSILLKYKASYIFLGDEERNEYKNAEELLQKNIALEKIYEQGNIKIFSRK